jgi:hypothetical protein
MVLNLFWKFIIHVLPISIYDINFFLFTVAFILKFQAQLQQVRSELAQTKIREKELNLKVCDK